ncbi:hypothetical protein [Actinacidiphila sp. bgisy167]|uniref:hypothetical protein n=1 Tax=Actinacidiphila sp. bgisy167 TaxID=3413797 RepID=UPI003D7035FB
MPHGAAGRPRRVPAGAAVGLFAALVCLLHALCAPGVAALQPLEPVAAFAVATHDGDEQNQHLPVGVGRRTAPPAAPQQRAGAVQGHAADIVHDTCPPNPVGAALRGPARHVAPAGRPDHLHLVLRC